jgi:hypothetical protein
VKRRLDPKLSVEHDIRRKPINSVLISLFARKSDTEPNRLLFKASTEEKH